MGLFDYFRNSRDDSAAVAKERLRIIVAHERAERNGPSYLPRLQKEILQVIEKYVKVDPHDVQINLDREDDCEILALNIVLPDPDEPQIRRA